MSDDPTYSVADGQDCVMRELTYSPLPWQTHTNDLVQQSQGWGPFHGAWSPWDFESAKDSQSGGSGIDITWLKGDNEVSYAPSYAVLSLMQDKSIDLVNNQGFVATLLQAADAPKLSSTIAQANTVQTTGVIPTAQGASGFWASLKNLFEGK